MPVPGDYPGRAARKPEVDAAQAKQERKGGASWADRHPHEPQIKRQLDAEGRCLVCGLMEATRMAEQRLRGAVAARDALAKLVREIRVSLFDGDGNKLPGSATAFAKIDATLGGGS